MNDLQFALRSLAKSPGFALATILTLALGIGSTSAIFSAADQVLFRPLPYPAPGQLVMLGYKTKRFDFLRSQLPVQLAAYREHATSFSSFAAFQPLSLNLVVDGEPRGVPIGRVSVDYFASLGAIPAIGRTFAPGEDQAGADHVVVLGHRLWRERFGADPAVLGRDVLLGGRQCRIVGVLPSEFQPPPLHEADVYQPLVLQIDPARPFGSYLYVIGRMQPGIAAPKALAELSTIKVPVSAGPARQLAEQELRVVPLAEVMRPRTSEAHWALLAAVGFLYAIACANAGNLIFARLHGRRRELSVRLALGCSRAQLVRLIAIENLVLTLLAGAAGVFVSQWIFPALLRLAPTGAAAEGVVSSLDWRALAFTAALSVFTAMLVSVPTAWRLARANVTEGLKEGAHALGETRRLRHMRGALVIVEAALAVALLVGAGLMVRSVQKLQHVDRGFDPANKVAVWLQLPGNILANPLGWRWQDCSR